MEYILNNNLSDFARRLGSKDKKKRNIQKAAGAAIAGAAGLALGRYGLKNLGKRVKKAQPLLSGSSQKALAAGKKGGAMTTNSSSSMSNTRGSGSKGSGQKALPPGRQGGDITKQKALPPSLDPNVYNAYRKKLPAGKSALSAGFDASSTRKSNIYRSGNPNQAVNRGNALPERTSKTKGRPKGKKNKGNK